MTAYGLGYSSVSRVPRIREDYGLDAPPQIQAQPTTIERIFGQLLQFIPGDVVGTYLFAVGLVPAATYATASWILFIVLTPFSTLLVYSGYLRAKRRGDVAASSLPVFRMCAAPAAFVVWALALPRSPLDSVWVFDLGWLKSIILAVGTLAISVLADVFDK
jgi:hypothetical protein